MKDRDPRKDPLEYAYEQLLERIESFQPRRAFDSVEVELCRRTTANNLKSAFSEAWDRKEFLSEPSEPLPFGGEAPEEDERRGSSHLTIGAARELIREYLFREPLDAGPKTKIQVNVPEGSARLMEIWAKREGRTVSSCFMEAALRGLSAMTADGHIPAAVIAENEWQIRLSQLHEDMRMALAESPFRPFED